MKIYKNEKIINFNAFFGYKKTIFKIHIIVSFHCKVFTPDQQRLEASRGEDVGQLTSKHLYWVFQCLSFSFCCNHLVNLLPD